MSNAASFLSSCFSANRSRRGEWRREGWGGGGGADSQCRHRGQVLHDGGDRATLYCGLPVDSGGQSSVRHHQLHPRTPRRRGDPVRAGRPGRLHPLRRRRTLQRRQGDDATVPHRRSAPPGPEEEEEAEGRLKMGILGFWEQRRRLV